MIPKVIAHVDQMLKFEMAAGTLTIKNMMKNANSIIHSEKIQENAFQMKKESTFGSCIPKIIKRMKSSIQKTTSLWEEECS